jgi:hypothetical protein
LLEGVAESREGAFFLRLNRLAHLKIKFRIRRDLNKKENCQVRLERDEKAMEKNFLLRMKRLELFGRK